MNLHNIAITPSLTLLTDRVFRQDFNSTNESTQGQLLRLWVTETGSPRAAWRPTYAPYAVYEIFLAEFDYPSAVEQIRRGEEPGNCLRHTWYLGSEHTIG